jgi:hypothetical protein
MEHHPIHQPAHGAATPAHGRRARRRRAALTALAALAALAVAAPAGALAASPPSAATESAHFVTYGSAILGGTVVANGSDTSYYFQYGVTKAYGAQTGIADAGAGSAPVKVAIPVTGLQPLTLYHYRLVAVNARGATIGSDRTLLTLKIPLSLQILASPAPVVFGGTLTIQGALSGTGNGDREVVLQANPWPYTGGFQNTGNPLLTLADGSFSFTVPSLTASTQYRVVSVTSPPVVSPVAQALVAVHVDSHLARARHGRVRVYGTVTPAQNGMQVAILREVRGRGVLVGGATLHAHGPASSVFSRLVPARRGVYRVLVRVTGGPQVSAYGQPLLIG